MKTELKMDIMGEEVEVEMEMDFVDYCNTLVHITKLTNEIENIDFSNIEEIYEKLINLSQQYRMRKGMKIKVKSENLDFFFSVSDEEIKEFYTNEGLQEEMKEAAIEGLRNLTGDSGPSVNNITFEGREYDSPREAELMAGWAKGKEGVFSITAEEDAEITQRFWEAFLEGLPEMDRDEFEKRFLFSVGQRNSERLVQALWKMF